jgi:hypothetical protein
VQISLGIRGLGLGGSIISLVHRAHSRQGHQARVHQGTLHIVSNRTGNKVKWRVMTHSLRNHFNFNHKLRQTGKQSQMSRGRFLLHAPHECEYAMKKKKVRRPVRRPSTPTPSRRPKASPSDGVEIITTLYTARPEKQVARKRTHPGPAAVLADGARVNSCVIHSGASRICGHQPGWVLWLL